MPDAQPAAMYPWDATTQAIVQALSQQQVPEQAIQAETPAQEIAQEEAPVQPLQQMDVPQPSQVAQPHDLHGAPLSASAPYMPTVTPSHPFQRLPVSALMQFGQLALNPHVEQARARVMQALLQPHQSSKAG